MLARVLPSVGLAAAVLTRQVADEDRLGQGGPLTGGDRPEISPVRPGGGGRRGEGTNLLFLLFVLSDSVKKMTAGTVTRPPPSPPPSICSRRREMVATEMSLTAESVLAVLLFSQRADWTVMPRI